MIRATFVSNIITFPQQEFEIELEGSQCLRILCYEKCYDKSKLNKDDNEIVDKIVGKGQVQVRKAKLLPTVYNLICQHFLNCFQVL